MARRALQLMADVDIDAISNHRHIRINMLKQQSQHNW